MGLEGRLAAVAGLSPLQRDRMYALMDRHYAGMKRPVFEADLDEKHWAILLCDSDTDEIFGFSTQMLFDAFVDGRAIRALFSGDTIVAKEHWGQIALMRAWGRLALELIDANPDAELFWFLIAKGYKTYRFLPVFFHTFFPRFDAPAPARMRRVRDAFARRLFPGRRDERRGIIQAQGDDACRLRPEIAQITANRLRDPHVRFFNESNPGHLRGDELCCIAPLTRANFTPAAYRAIGAESSVPLETA